ncbi:MAG: serine hydrolase [Melioribacteraceae bacterium]|nr:serine hydrolase [Melioribacteraceae bacterium]
MKSKFNIPINCFSLLLLFLFCYCSDENISDPPPLYSYEIPEKTVDGWEVGDLHDEGMSSEELMTLVDHINYHIIKEVHSVLIVKNGKLVFEEYFSGSTFEYSGNNHHGNQKDFNRLTIHNQASVTKSFTSALVGIAIDEGFIGSVNDNVFDYFPEYSAYNVGDKKNMTIEHLLTMSSGFDWNENNLPYGNNQNDLIRMWGVADPLEYLVAKPLSHTPGSHFYYNSGCTNLLGEVIYRASSTKPDVFADQFLFNKLGILSRSWEKFNNGVVFVSGDLKIRPRDMAKFGYLYLNNGVWNNQQIISEDWVNKSIENHITVNSIYNYGYKWWLRKYEFESKDYWSYSARGWGGQQITVFPELDMVLVFTGGNYATSDPVDQIIIQYIFPSIK